MTHIRTALLVCVSSSRVRHARHIKRPATDGTHSGRHLERPLLFIGTSNALSGKSGYQRLPTERSLLI